MTEAKRRIDRKSRALDRSFAEYTGVFGVVGLVATEDLKEVEEQLPLVEVESRLLCFFHEANEVFTDRRTGTKFEL